MFRMPALLINVAMAQSPYAFFDGRDIDYWREGKTISEAKPIREAKKSTYSTLVREGDAKEFSWGTYRDPKAPEFWDDGGDWIPPRPFREAAANPSKQNIAEYLDWQVRKTLVVNRFQAALTQNKQKPGGKVLWNELKVLYFYQSSCPHCRASVSTIEEVQRLGAKVTFVQMDGGEPLHKNSLHYDAAWAKEFAIGVTPTWIVKSKAKSQTLTGSLNLEELSEKLSGKDN